MPVLLASRSALRTQHYCTYPYNKQDVIIMDEKLEEPSELSTGEGPGTSSSKAEEEGCDNAGAPVSSSSSPSSNNNEDGEGAPLPSLTQTTEASSLSSSGGAPSSAEGAAKVVTATKDDDTGDAAAVCDPHAEEDGAIVLEVISSSSAGERKDEEDEQVDVGDLFRYPGRPMKNRDETVRMVAALVGGKAPAVAVGSSVNQGKRGELKKGSGSKAKAGAANSTRTTSRNISSTTSRLAEAADAAAADGLDVSMLEEEEVQDPVAAASTAPEPSGGGGTVQRRPPLSNVYGEGPFLVSDIPPSCLKAAASGGGVVLGIDEAGRGSVIGPMVYGAAYWNLDDEGEHVPKDFNDSKQLTEARREALFSKILRTPQIGFVGRVLHASEISRSMTRNYNLNQQSHGAARDMVRHVLNAGVAVSKCYVDTVGKAETYRRWLESELPGIEFVVESKADAKYAPCSAASVVAKVIRDRMLAHWKFTEDPYIEATTNFGSGYPSDPVCVEWLKNHLGCPVFGYPDVVRFSWGPVKKALAKGGAAVAFAADQDEDDEEEQYALHKQREQMSIFLGKKQAPAGNGGGGMTSRKRKRYSYFERKHLEVVPSL